MKETYVATAPHIRPYTFEVYEVDELKFGNNKVPQGNMIYEGEWGLGDSLIAAGIIVSLQNHDHGVLFLFHPDNVPLEDFEDDEDDY